MIFIYSTPFYSCHFQIHDFSIIFPYIAVYGCDRICIILIINCTSVKCFTIIFRKSTFITIPVMHLCIQCSIMPADRCKLCRILAKCIRKCIFIPHFISCLYPLHRNTACCSRYHGFRISSFRFLLIFCQRLVSIRKCFICIKFDSRNFF